MIADQGPNDDFEDDDTFDSEDVGGGEDESSTEIEGDDSHLHEDQKARSLDS